MSALVDVVVTEVEKFEQVTDRRTVDRHIWVSPLRLRVGEIVAAAACDGVQIPIPLDEFEDGNVIGIVVRDVPPCGVGRHNDQRNPRAVAEEVQRLNITGIIIAAAFVFPKV